MSNTQNTAAIAEFEQQTHAARSVGDAAEDALDDVTDAARDYSGW